MNSNVTNTYQILFTSACSCTDHSTNLEKHLRPVSIDRNDHTTMLLQTFIYFPTCIIVVSTWKQFISFKFRSQCSKCKLIQHMAYFLIQHSYDTVYTKLWNGQVWKKMELSIIRCLINWLLKPYFILATNIIIVRIISAIFLPLCCIYTLVHVWMMYKCINEMFVLPFSFFFSVFVFSLYKTYPVTLYFVKLVCRIQGSPTLAANLSIIMFMWWG